jgi:drug/metabolite transporter (DMT)-like permease
MSKNIKAHIACFIVNLIYGANFTIAKGIMPAYIQPFGFVVMRVTIAFLLFWVFHFMFIKEKIDKKDLPKFIVCGIFGVAINQLLFFKGLSLTSPINGAIIMTTNPILVIIIAAIILKERITIRKISGIILGLSGALALLVFGKNFSFGENTSLGDLFIFINAMSWGVFLVISKPLLKKYKPLTVIKWTFFFGCFFTIPFGFNQLTLVDWAHLPTSIWIGITYVVIGVTFIAYLLNTIALNTLSPSVVSFYIYLQPFFTAIISLIIGKDALTPLKIFSAILIFTGVYLVSVKPRIKEVMSEV